MLVLLRLFTIFSLWLQIPMNTFGSRLKKLKLKVPRFHYLLFFPHFIFTMLHFNIRSNIIYKKLFNFFEWMLPILHCQKDIKQNTKMIIQNTKVTHFTITITSSEYYSGEAIVIVKHVKFFIIYLCRFCVVNSFFICFCLV